MVQGNLKPGSLKDPELAQIFSVKDPESFYCDRREIGHGAFGAVFYAVESETKEPVAIKMMNFGGKQSIEKWKDIVREVRLLKSLSHNNIVEYKCAFLKEQTCWLIMEYCIGSLADILKGFDKKPALLETEIAEICSQSLQGLAYLHKLKKIHRDVKAANILLTESGKVKLADLGSASFACPTASFVGSPYWMAPEVIMAFESGEYSVNADIWSLGITCIELAESKPPLLEMNTYSALYHIVQNDSPCLKFNENGSDIPAWSDNFHSFVNQCLRKDPNQRISTEACLQHSFITNERLKNVIQDLIARVKMAVLESDRQQYDKIRRILHLEDGKENGQMSETCSTDVQDLDNSSERDGMHSESSNNNTIDKTSKAAIAHENKTVISVNGEGSVCSSNFDGDSTSTPANLSKSTISGLHMRANDHLTKEEINTLRRSKFSTLRTTKLIAKEVQEYQAENNIYEQMVGYKRLRQQHHKELKQLEERCQIEAENLRIKLDREYDQLNQTCQKECTKVKTQLQLELEKKLRSNDDELRKIRKSRIAQKKHAIKCYSLCQKKEYKYKKERIKNDLKQRGLSRVNYDVALRAGKANLAGVRSDAERQYEEEQNAILEAEMNEIQKQQLLQYHASEKNLVDNELNISARQLETLHALLIKHHERTKELESSHFRQIEQLKKRHLEVQHESELQNQRECNRRALEEKRKEHAVQSKQQPRELKTKEAMIRRQYRQAVKTQTRQFKAYQTQVLQSIPRDEHKEVLARLKEEQNRKLAALADQYETTIEKMVAEQTVKLDARQEDDLRQLTEKLNKELGLLTDYQERQKVSLQTVIERDRVQLQDRINLRYAVLEQKMGQERAHFERERDKRSCELSERQMREHVDLTSSVSPAVSSSEQTQASITGRSPRASASASSVSQLSASVVEPSPTKRHNSVNSTNL